MRTIKFRAWDKEKKIMYSFDEIMKVKIEKRPFGYDFYFRETYLPPENRRFPWTPNVILQQWYSSNPWLEIMQYTGLQDKNGKEIYEGDVVRFKYWDNDIPQDATNWGVVAYRNEMACFYLTQNVCITLAKQREMEIIGNIYEHSHLLSGGQQ